MFRSYFPELERRCKGGVALYMSPYSVDPQVQVRPVSPGSSSSRREKISRSSYSKSCIVTGGVQRLILHVGQPFNSGIRCYRPRLRALQPCDRWCISRESARCENSSFACTHYISPEDHFSRPFPLIDCASLKDMMNSNGTQQCSYLVLRCRSGKRYLPSSALLPLSE